MTAEIKRKVLLFILFALVTTVVIGSALPRLVFQPGMPPPSFERGQVAVVPPQGEPPLGVSVSTFFIVLALLIGAGLLIFAIYKIIKGVNWKELLSGIFSALMIVLVILGVLFLMESLLSKGGAPASTEPLPTPRPVVTAPLGPTPPALTWLVILGLLAAVIAAGVLIASAKPRPKPELWKLEAEAARDALLAGEDLKDVILHCYRRMSQALWEEQHIEREEYMTAEEFERLLAARGAPREPIHQLTQLFELVRYGRWQPATGDERLAIACLDAILAYSRETPLEAAP